MKGRIAAAAVLLGLSAGCGGREYAFERKTAREDRPAAPAGPGSAAALEAEFRSAWARRDEPQAVREAIEALKKILDARGGGDYETLVLLSRAHYLLGELAEEEQAKLQAFEAGMHWGDLALDAIPEFRRAFERTRTIEDAVGDVPRSGIAAIYWNAVNQAKWANEKGLVKVLFVKEKVKKMIDRVLALDETWWYGAAHRYLGAYYAALPSFAGRDLDASRRHFERSLEIAPDFFATHVLFAQRWARAANDRAAYRRHLERVLGTPAEVVPEVAPEQRIEQRKARKLLAEIDDHFEPEEAGAEPAVLGGGSQ